VLSVCLHADGTLEVLQADPYIEVTDQLLDSLDGERASYGDGILTIHAARGDVSYGLRDHDDIRETWLGVRSDVELDEVLE
jgi:hypothetical protein